MSKTRIHVRLDSQCAHVKDAIVTEAAVDYVRGYESFIVDGDVKVGDHVYVLFASWGTYDSFSKSDEDSSDIIAIYTDQDDAIADHKAIDDRISEYGNVDDSTVDLIAYKGRHYYIPFGGWGTSFKRLRVETVPVGFAAPLFHLKREVDTIAMTTEPTMTYDRHAIVRELTKIGDAVVITAQLSQRVRYVLSEIVYSNPQRELDHIEDELIWEMASKSAALPFTENQRLTSLVDRIEDVAAMGEIIRVFRKNRRLTRD